MNALLERLTGLTLLHPWALVLLAAVPVALWIRMRRAPSLLFAPAAFAAAERPFDEHPPRRADLPRSWRVALLPLPAALLAMGVALAVVALARPVRRDPLPLRSEGIEILLCLDTSSSMTAKDLDPQRTRLDVAKEAALQFVLARPADRIGLVTFARFPDVRCPPTRDHDALARILAEVATVRADSAEDATGIGAAVARAGESLRARGSPGSPRPGSRVVIVLTDGEENVALAQKPGEIAPSHAAQLCAAAGVRVHAIAVGAATPGRAPADTEPVQRMAETTGGRFWTAADAASLTGVYAAVDRMERSAQDEPRWALEECFQPFVAAALAFVAASRLLGASLLRVLP